MQRLGWMMALVVVAVACGTAGDMVGEMLDAGVPDAGAQPTPTAKFVGYTSAGYRLSPNSNASLGGLFNTYAACQADFGASARICTTAEVLGTADLPQPPPDSDGNVGAGAWMVETLDTVPNCWAGGASGSYLSPIGEFGSQDCRSLRVLACCTVN